MKIFIFLIGSFLFISIAFYGCSPNSQERTSQTDEEVNKSIIKKGQTSEITWMNKIQGYFVDTRDGKIYKVVKIGTQTWLAENLAYKPGRGNYWAFDSNEIHVARYGYLYFWETAKNACPTGWHLPGNEEWNTLINFLGGKAIAGGKLKATVGWNIPNKGATNSSGLGILPGGNRAVDGSFHHLGNDALFWSGTTKGSRSAWKVRLNYNADSVSLEVCSRLTGLSVRCIRD